MLSIEDERQIVVTVLRYATAIDGRDWPLFRSCFGSDFRGDYGQFGSRWHSGDEIAAWMKEAHRQIGVTMHRMSNIVVTGSGITATERTYGDVVVVGERGPKDPVHTYINIYEGELQKFGAEWKFVRRNMSVLLRDGCPLGGI